MIIGKRPGLRFSRRVQRTSKVKKNQKKLGTVKDLKRNSKY